MCEKINGFKCPKCGDVKLFIKQADGRTRGRSIYWVFCETCKFDGVIEIGTQAAQDVRP
jgi:predicted RNA-binding Zn-ribbon protein involved in translation (DUF1610 family)